MKLNIIILILLSIFVNANTSDTIEENKSIITLVNENISDDTKLKCEEQKNIDACLKLQEAYFIFLKNKNLGIKYAKIGCELGNSMSCNNLAVAYEEDGIYNNNELAIRYYNKACEMKYEGACFTLGEIYSKQNSSKAINYYDKSCRLNNSVACVRIGYIFSQGLYSSKIDKKKAFNYYKKGADLGDGDAQLNLGIFYYIGENGIERNFGKSIMYLEQSAKQGNVKAYYVLGMEYFTYNEKYKSAFWIKKAMDSGSEDAKTMWFNEKLWDYQ